MILKEYYDFTDEWFPNLINISASLITKDNNNGIIVHSDISSTDINASLISMYNNEWFRYKLFINNSEYIANNINMLRIKLDINNHKNFNIKNNPLLLRDFHNIMSSSLLNLYKYNFIIDLRLYNFTYDSIYKFSKIGRIYNNNMQILNCAMNSNNSDISKTDDIGFIFRYKIIKNNIAKYLIPKIKNNDNQDIFFTSISDIIYKSGEYETDSSANIFNGMIDHIDFIEVSESDYSTLYENKINYIYFDIYAFNSIIPKRILIENSNINGFNTYPVYDVQLKYNSNIDFILAKSNIISKIKDYYSNYVNFNLNNIILSSIDDIYPDQTITNIDIFIIYNNYDIDIVGINNLFAISPRYNVRIKYDVTTTKSTDRLKPVIVNDFLLDFASPERMYIYHNTNKINMKLDSTNVYGKELDYYNITDNTSNVTLYNIIDYNNIFKENIDIFNEKINKYQYNGLTYNKDLMLGGPFGLSQYEEFRIRMNGKILFCLNNITEGLALYNLTSNIGNPIAGIYYNITDKTQSGLDIDLFMNITNKLLQELNVSISTLTKDLIDSIVMFIDRSYMLKVVIDRIYQMGFYNEYKNNDIIINIILYTKMKDYQHILDVILNELSGLKLYISVYINNKDFSTTLDLWDINISGDNITLKYLFSPAMLKITYLNTIEYFKINHINLIF